MNSSADSVSGAAHSGSPERTGSSPVKPTIKEREKLRRKISQCDRDIAVYDRWLARNSWNVLDLRLKRWRAQRYQLDFVRKSARNKLKGYK